jgi:NitT/TauT family transport system substrate-binding protein
MPRASTVRGNGRAAIAAAVAVAVLAACWPRREVRRERVVLATTTTPNAALVHLAAASGDFVAEGLDVEVRAFSYGQLALAALVAGQADLATAADTPLALALAGDQRLKVLAAIASTHRGNELLVRAGEGIASPRDLVGRRIGVARGTSADFFLERVLSRSGIGPSDVVLVDLKPDATAPALARGDVAAVAAFPPYTGEIRRALGARAATVPARASYSVFALMTSPELAEQRRGVPERVLRALRRAAERVRADRAGAARIVARAIGMEPAELARVMENLVLEVALEHSLLVLLEEEVRWAIRTGLGPGREVPDLRRAIEPSPLRSVSRRAVRLTW